MEFPLRDTRHLAGRRPQAEAPVPGESGLALALRHDEHGAPALVVGRSDGTLAHLRFEAQVDLLVEEARYCVGTRDEDGWTPCPRQREADRFDRCPECHPLPERDCVFNPRCTSCTQEFCNSPHEIYIAYYGPTPKVGMTRSARQGGRLVEQGADAWFHVATVADRFAARNLEDRITAELQIPQTPPAKKLFTRLTQKIPLDTMESHRQSINDKLASLTKQVPGPLQPLPRGPGLPLPGIPLPIAVVGHHHGERIAAHGRHLYYRDPQKTALWALDLKRVVTHPVRFHADALNPTPPR